MYLTERFVLVYEDRQIFNLAFKIDKLKTKYKNSALC